MFIGFVLCGIPGIVKRTKIDRLLGVRIYWRILVTVSEQFHNIIGSSNQMFYFKIFSNSSEISMKLELITLKTMKS